MTIYKERVQMAISALSEDTVMMRFDRDDIMAVIEWNHSGPDPAKHGLYVCVVDREFSELGYHGPFQSLEEAQKDPYWSKDDWSIDDI